MCDFCHNKELSVSVSLPLAGSIPLVPDFRLHTLPRVCTKFILLSPAGGKGLCFLLSRGNSIPLGPDYRINHPYRAGLQFLLYSPTGGERVATLFGLKMWITLCMRSTLCSVNRYMLITIQLSYIQRTLHTCCRCGFGEPPFYCRAAV